MVTHRLHFRGYSMSQREYKSKKYPGVYIDPLLDGSKTYSIVFKDPITKKTTRRKVGNSKEGFTETYAHNFRIEAISKLRLGEDTKIPILEKKRYLTTLNDLKAMYFDHKSVDAKKKSIRDRMSKYDKHLKDSIGSKSIKSLTKQDAINIQKNMLKKNYANHTINTIIELASTIINYCIKEGLYTGNNPFYGIKKLSVDNQRLRFLSKDEVKKLLDEVKGDEVLHLFTLLALTTGARLQSVLSIQKKDINFSTNTINLTDAKNNNQYKGFLKEDVKKMLSERLKGLKNDDFVISYDRGQPVEVKAIQRRLRPILNRLFNSDLKEGDRANRVVIHTLRHTFASLLVINGTPLYTVQKLMNHKDIKQTSRYAKLAPDSGLNEVRRIF